MWAKAVTADSLSSLFSLASEEAMGGPPASRLSFLSEFWLQMSHFCHILSAKRKKNTSLTSLQTLLCCSQKQHTHTSHCPVPAASIVFPRATPLTAPNAAESSHGGAAGLWRRGDVFFFSVSVSLIWNLEHCVTTGGWHNSIVAALLLLLEDTWLLRRLKECDVTAV